MGDCRIPGGDGNLTPLIEFQRQCLNMTSALVNAEANLFAMLDDQGQPLDIVRRCSVQGIEPVFWRCLKDLAMFNPLLCTDAVVATDIRRHSGVLRGSGSLNEFGRWVEYPHLACMYFRRQQRVVAIIGMQRHSTMGSFSREEQQRLEVVQPVIEHALNQAFLVPSGGRIH